MKSLTSNILFLIIAGVLVISIGSFAYIKSSDQDKNLSNYQNDNYKEQQAVTETRPASTTQGTVKKLTLAEIATHNNQSSCWTAVNGNVYDVTSYINSHPGGQRAIESICGVDGGGAFNNQHGGASKPERVLQSFLIGTLK